MPRDDWAKAKRRDFGNSAAREGRAFHAGAEPSPKAKKRRKRRIKSQRDAVGGADLPLSYREWCLKLAGATSDAQLDCIGRDLVQARRRMSPTDYRALIEAGKLRRAELCQAGSHDST